MDAAPKDATVANRLVEARIAAGFANAKDAAETLGVPYPTYAGHENGSRGIRPDSAVHYARRFRVPLEWLLTGKGGIDRAAPSDSLSAETVWNAVYSLHQHGAFAIRDSRAVADAVVELSRWLAKGDRKVDDNVVSLLFERMRRASG